MSKLMQAVPPPPHLKNKAFRARLGFAAYGVRLVTRREKSFRAQLILAAAALLLVLALRPGWIWAALVTLAIGLVLALELANSALEYLIDHLHPQVADEIGAAKDAAAGAVLVASVAAAAIGLMMVLSLL